MLNHVEAAHLVEAEDVVGVTVGEQDRVDAPHVVRERLHAQVGRRIDQDVTNRCAKSRSSRIGLRALDQDRGPAASIAGVGGATGVAVAPNHRHTVRGAGAEHRDLEPQWIRARPRSELSHFCRSS